MGDDQMMFDVHRSLYIVTHHAAAAATCRHRAGIGIAQRDLLVRRGQHPGLKLSQALHLLLQRGYLVFEADRLGGARQRWLLPIGVVQLVQVACDALLDLRHAALHLGPREVLVPAVHRLELGAVDRHAGIAQQIKLAAQGDKLNTDLTDRPAIVFTEFGDRLVIRRQAAGQLHHFHVAPRLLLKPAARLNPVEVAVNIELQQHARMIARPAGCLRDNPAKAQAAKIKLIDKHVDHPHSIIFADVIIQMFRK